MANFTEQIAVTADDGYFESTGATFDDTSAVAVIGVANFSVDPHGIVFLRFPGITIPQASTITAATLTVRSAQTSSVTLRVAGELAGNPGQIASAVDGQGRTRTTHSTVWSIPTFTSGSDFTSPDITTIIQEIVNQGGFASGNALQLFLDLQAQSGAFSIQIVAEDGAHLAGRATISIDYSGVVIPKTSRPFWLFDD